MSAAHAHRVAEREAEYAQRLRALEPLLALAGRAEGAGTPEERYAERVTGMAPGRLTAEEARRVRTAVDAVHRDGYAIMPLLSADAVARTAAGLDPLFAGTRALFARARAKPAGPRGRPVGQTHHIQNVLAKTRAVDEAATHPALRAVIAGVLGPDFIFNAGAVAMSPDPGCEAQGLHRDDGFFPLPRPRPPAVVTAAVALDDFSRRNGGTMLVPRSHTWEESRAPKMAEVVYAEMPAGSVLIWDGSLFHGGGGNSTADQSRRTLTFNYTRGWMRTQFNQYLSVPRATVLAMPPELQADMGYRASLLGLHTCEGQDPIKYLTRMMKAGGDGSQPTLGLESKL